MYVCVYIYIYIYVYIYILHILYCIWYTYKCAGSRTQARTHFPPQPFFPVPAPSRPRPWAFNSEHESAYQINTHHHHRFQEVAAYRISLPNEDIVLSLKRSVSRDVVLRPKHRLHFTSWFTVPQRGIRKWGSRPTKHFQVDLKWMLLNVEWLYGDVIPLFGSPFGGLW